MTTTTPVIELTERARTQVRHLLTSTPGTDGFALRIGVETGGCAGYTYNLSLVPGAEAEDAVHSQDGFDVVVASSVAHLLQGMRVDYAETLTSSGFTFTNPNAKSSCGCGSSFGASDTPERSEADVLLRERVEEAMAEIRPFLQGDGGDAEIVAVLAGGGQPGSAEVHLKLTGACGSCSSAGATLSGVIEARLKELLPEIGRVALVA
ncbi:iron-sulfur cluster assembly accessory protein [Frankia sp. AgKG'84/4]|uniref:iron-sulfur cluster assembly accessory protein n=1 Tax=Frankia sp. AgKG'84/4 TaxID=573490 RepID=UPI00200D4A78|nr:iron-sulfur cluster assembly accessory protein [Frankia sp. AgKG'84/4]MCL9794762.1 iron-sulfur cluster assembly accessory protein [Frankia sp. AgKG'84/4]